MLYSGFNSIYVRMCENDNCLIGHENSFGNTIIKLYISTVRAQLCFSFKGYSFLTGFIE